MLTESALIIHRLLNRWTDIFILPSPAWVGAFNLDNATQTLCKTLRKYHFRHAKGKSMVNFYIVNALGQNLANPESCPILRL